MNIIDCDFNLSVRAQNILNLAKIRTIKQLIKLNPFTLLGYRGCGVKTIAEISGVIDKAKKQK